MSPFKPDRAKTMASQLASKGYYAGEAVGFRVGRASGKFLLISLSCPDDITTLTGLDGLDDRLKFVPEKEISQLKKRISAAIIAIRDKQSSLIIADLKKLLFRAAASLISIEQVCFTNCFPTMF